MTSSSLPGCGSGQQNWVQSSTLPVLHLVRLLSFSGLFRSPRGLIHPRGWRAVSEAVLAWMCLCPSLEISVHTGVNFSHAFLLPVGTHPVPY